MHSIRSILLLTVCASAATASHAAQFDPASITSSGDIQVDQSSQTVEIAGEVEIHRAPFYLQSDRVRWQRGRDQLQILGNVRLSVSPDERQAGATIHPLLLANPDAPAARIEVLRTEKLIFDLANNAILPTGPSKVQVGQARLVGEGFAFDLESDRIRTSSYRAGFNYLFLEGKTLTVEGPNLLAKDAHFFWGEPDAFSFQGRARSVEKLGEDAVILRGITLQLGAVPFFYWPYYRQPLDRQVFTLTGSVGYSGDLGAYVEARPSYQPKEGITWFADFNYYDDRGWLMGPGFEIEQQWSNGHSLRAHLESGFINDRGELGKDALDIPIDPKRDYVDFSMLHRFGSSLQVLSRIERWSDTEILRDFAPGRFRPIQQPQSFVEATGVWGPIALNVNTHFRHQAFEHTLERSPEVSLSLLPSAVPGTRLFHAAHLSGVQLRDRSPGRPEDLKYTRLRGYYQIWCPLALTHWLDFTPQATAQQLSYRNIGQGHPELNPTHFQFGFDLTAHAFGDWNLRNAAWDIQGLRHILRPTLQFRRLESRGDRMDTIVPIEARIYRTGVDDIDLSASSSVDALEPGSLIRVGLLNALVAHRSSGTFQKWVDLDLFHDTFLPERNAQPDTNSFALQANLRPAHWLRLELQARADTDDFAMQDLFARLSIVDGDIWDFDLATQFVRGDLQQYLLGFRYKLTEDLRFVSTIGYDQRGSRFYEQSYGIQYAISNFWDLLFNVSLREGSTRNNRTRFELKIKTARF